MGSGSESKDGGGRREGWAAGWAGGRAGGWANWAGACGQVPAGGCSEAVRAFGELRWARRAPPGPAQGLWYLPTVVRCEGAQIGHRTPAPDPFWGTWACRARFGALHLLVRGKRSALLRRGGGAGSVSDAHESDPSNIKPSARAQEGDQTMRHVRLNVSRRWSTWIGIRPRRLFWDQ